MYPSIVWDIPRVPPWDPENRHQIFLNRYTQEEFMSSSSSSVCRIAVLLFVVLFGGLVWMRPRCWFHEQGGYLREFGVGSQDTTVFPLWVCSLLLGVLCYLVAMQVG